MLEDEYGIAPRDIEWISALHNRPEAHVEDVFDPPSGVAIRQINGNDSSTLLETGEVDAMMGAHPPNCFLKGAKNVGRLFPDYQSVEDFMSLD